MLNSGCFYKLKSDLEKVAVHDAIAYSLMKTAWQHALSRMKQDFGMCSMSWIDWDGDDEVAEPEASSSELKRIQASRQKEPRRKFAGLARLSDAGTDPL